MPNIYKKALVKHSDKQFFAVVNEVARYPDFIEWCHRVEVLKENDHILQARLHVQKGLLHANFSTENSLTYPTAMNMRLLSGPFKRFTGEWRFNQQADGQCEIEFSLEYEFSNRLLEMSMGAIFFHLANDMVQTFIQRADALYG